MVTRTACVLLILLASLARAQDVPLVPTLKAGSETPFVAEGWVRIDNYAMRFYVASNAERQLVAIINSADNVPILISNEKRLLVYDAIGERIVNVPTGRANVSVSYDAAAERSMKFGIGAGVKSDPEKHEPTFFQPDRFAAAARDAFVTERLPDGRVVRTLKKDQSHISLIQAPGDPTAFEWVSDAPTGQLRVVFRSIGQPIDDAAFAFPDVQAIAKSATVVEMKQGANGFLQLLQFISSGRGIVVKMALAQPEPQRTEQLKGVKIDLDAAEVQRRDAKLSDAFLTGLKDQDLPFMTVPRTGPTTNSTREQE
jgi:hypothetical protein